MSALHLRIEGEIAIIEFDQPDSKVNVLTTEAMNEFSDMLKKVSGLKNPKIKALVITSSKEGIFIAGADIKEIESISSAEEAIAKAESGKGILDTLSGLDVLTVAAINGACLGGGLELALACTHRVASFSNKVKIGLPEVNLGIIPGFGGTQRLPKIIGLTPALTMILSGKPVSGKEALKYGLVSALFPEISLTEETLRFTASLLRGEGKSRTRKKRKKLFQIFLEKTPLGRAIVYRQTKKNILKRTKGFYPAPLKALEVIQKTYGGNFQKGSYTESLVFGELAATETSKNLIKVFYLNEEFKKYPWISNDCKPAAIKKCGVLGAGVMGGGIAQLLTYCDIPTRLKDINYDSIKTALKTAYDLFGHACKRKRIKKHAAEHKFGLLSPSLSYQGFENVDLVIEAVVENLSVKQKVFKELGEITEPRTVIASNTSSLPIEKISATMRTPQRAVGLHFFNPVHRMPLVEVIKSKKTDKETLATIIAFARNIRKVVIVVGDVPGFLVNRILLSYLNEAAFLLEEGMKIEEIDKIVRRFGMPMGPLELIDEVGIDVGYKVIKILQDAYGTRMRVPSILEEVKQNGLLGKKAKLGFYIHKGKRRLPNEKIYSLKKSASVKLPEAEVALKRMIYVMINEAARCLEENVADRPQVVDVGMIMGTGFPPFRGGLLRYADSVGLKTVVNDLMRFEQEYKAKRLRPCAYLRQKADNNKGFYL